MCHLPEAQLIVAGNMNGGVHWVDLADPSATRNVTHHQKGVFAARRLGDAVLTAGGDGVLTRWSVAARRSTESLQLSGKSLRCFDYNPERQELAVGASDGNIYLLSAADFALIQVLQDAHQPSVFSVCYSQDGRTLYSGGRDAHLKSWARNTGGWVLDQVAPAHHFTINDIAIHPGGQVLATASRDKTVKLWRASDLRLLKVIDTVRDQGHLNSVNRLMWLPERKMLLSAGDDRSILGWEVDLF